MKVAMVTGGANGMGAEECRLFAGEGAKVAIADIREEDGRRVEAEIAEAGGDAMFVNLNVSDEDSWIAAVGQVVGGERREGDPGQRNLGFGCAPHPEDAPGELKVVLAGLQLVGGDGPGLAGAHRQQPRSLGGVGLQLGEAGPDGAQQLDHRLGGVRLERPVHRVAPGGLLRRAAGGRSQYRQQV